MLCGEHGERVLAPCEHCGVLVIVSARVHVCIECARSRGAARRRGLTPWRAHCGGAH